MHSNRSSDERLWDMVDRIKISLRIACPPRYPAGEAKYATEAEWERATGKSFREYCNREDVQAIFYE